MTEAMNADAWLNEHGDYLYRFALSKVHDDELAADMVQEALLAAWRGKSRFKGDSTLRTWLVSILKHKIIDHIRKDIRQRKISDALENDPSSHFFSESGEWQTNPRTWHDNPEQCCDDLKFRLVLKECLTRLPEKQRRVFELRELADEDTDTICKACDVTSTNLHVLMYRARLSLQACLQKHWFGGAST
ncbi:MAG: sigma-70 family RNA polymerase sigma factor [Zetaproteobacteria bacterium]|nr:sigma-70 family RNA polymerase sigma factor [Zetaproteobacteria bacterium]